MKTQGHVTIYLIDDYDGYIIDVIRDAWRW